MRESRRGAAVPLVLGAAAVVAGLLAGGVLLLRDDAEPARASRPTPVASAAASPSPVVRPSAPTPSASPSPSRPLAVGSGIPDCNGPCTVQHRLTRSFLPGYAGQQTLLLSGSAEEDANGNFLHAFLIDEQGRVLWEEHGFGWSFRRVDDKHAIRFDEAGHVFFRAYVADFTYLYVLHTTGTEPRLVGPPDGEPTDGFQDGQLLTGEPAFGIRESVADCPEDGETPVEACPRTERTYRWDGTRYVRAS